jgi:hypothetical protein
LHRALRVSGVRECVAGRESDAAGNVGQMVRSEVLPPCDAPDKASGKHVSLTMAARAELPVGTVQHYKTFGAKRR